jgi:membrane protease YdiL (CAAX protease family)
VVRPVLERPCLSGRLHDPAGSHVASHADSVCKISAIPAQVQPTAGVVLWVGLCKLDIEEKLFPKIGLGSFTDLGGRAAYNPLEALGGYPLLLCGFLVVRFIGLALVVPIIEEFILRGFIVRFVLNPEEWLSLPCGVVNRVSLTLPAVYGLLTHPAEALAAVVWFSLVTWLMVRTQNLWDCVMAHAVTNFLLGIYVLTSGDWELW